MLKVTHENGSSYTLYWSCGSYVFKHLIISVSFGGLTVYCGGGLQSPAPRTDTPTHLRTRTPHSKQVKSTCHSMSPEVTGCEWDPGRSFSQGFDAEVTGPFWKWPAPFPEFTPTIRPAVPCMDASIDAVKGGDLKEKITLGGQGPPGDPVNPPSKHLSEQAVRRPRSASNRHAGVESGAVKPETEG